MPEASPPPRIVYVTGTGTGVGKTLLTGLLLSHLRRHGGHALAIKPFCSGSRADARLLRAVGDRKLTIDEVNPWFFPEPVAPLVSARIHRRSISLSQVEQHIDRMAARCDCVLIEGAGGLLAPLGEGFTLLDLITRQPGEVLVASRNQLGTINHTLLTVQALLQAANQTSQAGARATGTRRRQAQLAGDALAFRRGLNPVPVRVALMDGRLPDPSAPSNPGVLLHLLAPTPLVRIPYLGSNLRTPAAIQKACRQVQAPLARLLA